MKNFSKKVLTKLVSYAKLTSKRGDNMNLNEAIEEKEYIKTNPKYKSKY